MEWITMAKQSPTCFQNHLCIRNITRLTQFAFGVLGLFTTNLALAKGEVTRINTHTEAAIAASTYSSHAWGQGDNLVIDSFVFGGSTYETNIEADTVIIRRSNGGSGLFL